MHSESQDEERGRYRQWPTQQRSMRRMVRSSRHDHDERTPKSEMPNNEDAPSADVTDANSNKQSSTFEIETPRFHSNFRRKKNERKIIEEGDEVGTSTTRCNEPSTYYRKRTGSRKSKKYPNENEESRFRSETTATSDVGSYDASAEESEPLVDPGRPESLISRRWPYSTRQKETEFCSGISALSPGEGQNRLQEVRRLIRDGERAAELSKRNLYEAVLANQRQSYFNPQETDDDDECTQLSWDSKPPFYKSHVDLCHQTFHHNKSFRVPVSDAYAYETENDVGQASLGHKLCYLRPKSEDIDGNQNTEQCRLDNHSGAFNEEDNSEKEPTLTAKRNTAFSSTRDPADNDLNMSHRNVPRETIYTLRNIQAMLLKKRLAGSKPRICEADFSAADSSIDSDESLLLDSPPNIHLMKKKLRKSGGNRKGDDLVIRRERSLAQTREETSAQFAPSYLKKKPKRKKRVVYEILEKHLPNKEMPQAHLRSQSDQVLSTCQNEFKKTSPHLNESHNVKDASLEPTKYVDNMRSLIRHSRPSDCVDGMDDVAKDGHLNSVLIANDNKRPKNSDLIEQIKMQRRNSIEANRILFDRTHEDDYKNIGKVAPKYKAHITSNHSARNIHESVIPQHENREKPTKEICLNDDDGDDDCDDDNEDNGKFDEPTVKKLSDNFRDDDQHLLGHHPKKSSEKQFTNCPYRDSSAEITKDMLAPGQWYTRDQCDFIQSLPPKECSFNSLDERAANVNATNSTGSCKDGEKAKKETPSSDKSKKPKGWRRNQKKNAPQAARRSRIRRSHSLENNQTGLLAFLLETSNFLKPLFTSHRFGEGDPRSSSSSSSPSSWRNNKKKTKKSQKEISHQNNNSHIDTISPVASAADPTNTVVSPKGNAVLTSPEKKQRMASIKTVLSKNKHKISKTNCKILKQMTSKEMHNFDSALLVSSPDDYNNDWESDLNIRQLQTNIVEMTPYYVDPSQEEAPLQVHPKGTPENPSEVEEISYRLYKLGKQRYEKARETDNVNYKIDVVSIQRLQEPKTKKITPSPENLIPHPQSLEKIRKRDVVCLMPNKTTDLKSTSSLSQEQQRDLNESKTRKRGKRETCPSKTDEIKHPNKSDKGGTKTVGNEVAEVRSRLIESATCRDKRVDRTTAHDDGSMASERLISKRRTSSRKHSEKEGHRKGGNQQDTSSSKECKNDNQQDTSSKERKTAQQENYKYLRDTNNHYLNRYNNAIALREKGHLKSRHENQRESKLHENSKAMEEEADESDELKEVTLSASLENLFAALDNIENQLKLSRKNMKEQNKEGNIYRLLRKTSPDRPKLRKEPEKVNRGKGEWYKNAKKLNGDLKYLDNTFPVERSRSQVLEILSSMKKPNKGNTPLCLGDSRSEGNKNKSEKKQVPCHNNEKTPPSDIEGNSERRGKAKGHCSRKGRIKNQISPNNEIVGSDNNESGVSKNGDSRNGKCEGQDSNPQERSTTEPDNNDMENDKRDETNFAIPYIRHKAFRQAKAPSYRTTSNGVRTSDKAVDEEKNTVARPCSYKAPTLIFDSSKVPYQTSNVGSMQTELLYPLVENQGLYVTNERQKCSFIPERPHNKYIPRPRKTPIVIAPESKPVPRNVDHAWGDLPNEIENNSLKQTASPMTPLKRVDQTGQYKGCRHETNNEVNGIGNPENIHKCCVFRTGLYESTVEASDYSSGSDSCHSIEEKKNLQDPTRNSPCATQQNEAKEHVKDESVCLSPTTSVVDSLGDKNCIDHNTAQQSDSSMSCHDTETMAIDAEQLPGVQSKEQENIKLMSMFEDFVGVRPPYFVENCCSRVPQHAEHDSYEIGCLSGRNDGLCDTSASFHWTQSSYLNHHKGGPKHVANVEKDYIACENAANLIDATCIEGPRLGLGQQRDGVVPIGKWVEDKHIDSSEYPVEQCYLIWKNYGDRRYENVDDEEAKYKEVKKGEEKEGDEKSHALLSISKSTDDLSWVTSKRSSDLEDDDFVDYGDSCDELNEEVENIFDKEEGEEDPSIKHQVASPFRRPRLDFGNCTNLLKYLSPNDSKERKHYEIEDDLNKQGYNVNVTICNDGDTFSVNDSDDDGGEEEGEEEENEEEDDEDDEEMQDKEYDEMALNSYDEDRGLRKKDHEEDDNDDEDDDNDDDDEDDDNENEREEDYYEAEKMQRKYCEQGMNEDVKELDRDVLDSLVNQLNLQSKHCNNTQYVIRDNLSDEDDEIDDKNKDGGDEEDVDAASDDDDDDDDDDIEDDDDYNDEAEDEDVNDDGEDDDEQADDDDEGNDDTADLDDEEDGEIYNDDREEDDNCEDDDCDEDGENN